MNSFSQRMCRRLALGLFVPFRYVPTLFAMALSGSVLCHAQAELKMPPGRALPKMVLPDPNVKAEQQGWMVFIAAKGFKPRASWEDNASPLKDAPSLRFMESVFAILEYQAPGTMTNNWMLVGKKKDGDRRDLTIDSIYGWVPRDMVLDTNKCRTNPLSGIHKKLLMVNDPTLKAIAGDKMGWLVGTPRPDAADFFQVKLYEPLFVYKFVPREDSAKFALVGLTPEIQVATAQQQIKGWVDLEKTPHAFWNTRQGIEWNYLSTWPDVKAPDTRRIAPVKTYAEVGDAYGDYYRDLAPMAPENPRILFEEKLLELGPANRPLSRKSLPPHLAQRYQDLQDKFPTEKVSRPYKPEHSRPPLLETGEEGQARPGLPLIVRTRGNNELLRIGGIGGRGSLTAAQIDEIRNECSKRVGDVQAVELLFVVDRTGSMNDFFPAVADTIKRITDDAQRGVGQTGNVKIGIVMYDDRETDAAFNRQRPTPTELVHALEEVSGNDGRSRGQRMADLVRGKSAVGGGEPGEEMVQGMIDAVNHEKVVFSPWSYKIIVVLTDDGDRIGAPVENNQPGALATESKLLNRLREVVWPADSSPRHVVIVQVKEPDNRPESRSLVRQVKYLQEQTWARDPESKQQLIETVIATNREAAIARINEKYETARQAAKRLADEIASLASANPVEVGPEAKRLWSLANPGLAIEEYLAKGEGNQVFRPGYVWKWPLGQEGKQDKQQCKTCALLTKPEIEDINYTIRNLLRNAETKTPRDALKEMIDILAKGTPAEAEETSQLPESDETSQPPKAGKTSRTTGNDLFKARFGIELSSPLFRVDPANLDARLARQDIEDIRRRYLILEGIEKGVARSLKPSVIELAGEKLTRWEVEKEIPHDRFFSRYTDDETRWCWVSEDELP